MMHIVVDTGDSHCNFLVTEEEFDKLLEADNVGQVLVLHPNPQVKTAGEILEFFGLDN